MLEIRVPELPEGANASVLSIRFSAGDRIVADKPSSNMHTILVIASVMLVFVCILVFL
jgi:hypothetical protein